LYPLKFFPTIFPPRCNSIKTFPGQSWQGTILLIANQFRLSKLMWWVNPIA
jgi:hypothetical protein